MTGQRTRGWHVLTPDEVADVVVVGGGGSGLAAAASAAESGSDVLVLERRAQLGGTTGISLGAVVANGSPQQRRAGIADHPSAHADDWERAVRAAGREDSVALRRVYVDEVGPTVTWLTSAGVSFAGPFPDAPNSVPRLHMALPDSRILVARLAVLARRNGVRIARNVRVVELVVDRGRVVGAAVVGEGVRTVVRARRGVVLASGDFTANEELKRRFLGESVASVPAINPHSRGDGHLLGESVGSLTLNGSSAIGPQLRLSPPTRRILTRRLPATAAVSRAAHVGHRLLPARILERMTSGLLASYMAVSADLLASGALIVDRSGDAVDSDPSGAGETFVVLDEELADRFSRWPHFVSTAPGVAYAYVPDYLRARKDAAADGTSVDIARALGIDEGGLSRSVRRHFDREVSRRYVALGPLRPWMVVTDGGLRTSPTLEVLRTDGSVVEGLFACGSVGQGGLQLLGNGLHLGWAMVSGRVAGRSVGRTSVRSADAEPSPRGDRRP